MEGYIFPPTVQFYFNYVKTNIVSHLLSKGTSGREREKERGDRMKRANRETEADREDDTERRRYRQKKLTDRDM